VFLDFRHENYSHQPEKGVWCNTLLKSIPASRRREIELLICCARTRLDPKVIERIHSLAKNGIDWEYLMQAAARHRLMPLLCRSLEKTCAQAVPGEIMDRLQADFRFNTRRNLAFSGKLLKLLKHLKERNIPAIPFKGPALAEYVYGDLSLRQFNDLDILVRKRDAFSARNLLISRGYRPEIQLNDSQYKVFVKLKNSAPFISNDGKIAVDLHWEMTGRYSLLPFDLESLENRAVHASLAGKQVEQFSPEDLLLYLCHHGALHCWMQLEMICSVAELVGSHAGMDWRRIQNLVTELRCERILFLGLFLAHDLLGAPLPDHILDRVEADPKVQKLAMALYKNLFLKDGESPKNEINPKFSLFHLQVREKFFEKIRYALHLATNPTKEDWRLLSLPAFLSALHYVYRPLRLATGFGEVLLRRYLVKLN